MLKKGVLLNKTENFHKTSCKQISDSTKFKNNIKVFAEPDRSPRSINNEKHIFKYLQRFLSIDKEKYLHRVFEEDTRQ